MAFFRAMGADSVAYHKETVVSRGDDHAGQALNYYGERGETPLRWGGRLAGRLGLAGEVTHEEFDAVFAAGGFRDPVTGEQLTRVKRPGFEWVIGPHKSVAVLGVIGRAEDMHAVLDAERDASLGFVEDWWLREGGSRGREQIRTPTRGLLWAVTRHGTTRAGDPHPHDHILFANITEMRDAKGGCKALDSAALRDITEAATMDGRLHSAWTAVQLGYAIETDEGLSGRARRWRVAGIPDEVCELFSKRADDIARYLEDRGQSSYRARNIAARATRDVKRHTGVDELMPEWHAELDAIGWPVERLGVALEAARRIGTAARSPFPEAEIDALAAGLMDPGSPFMTAHKVFNRWNLIEEIAPHLYGQDPAELDRVLHRVLSSDLVVPLIGGPYSRQRTYASSLVLANEATIAERVDWLAVRRGPDVARDEVSAAIAAKERALGHRLTAGQRQAVENICGPTGAVKVVVGVAGSGKTTALDAATDALTAAGYDVIGTATSGQAARTLATEAGIEARTTRSLLWRLDHGRRLRLDDRSVVILDEAGMTADADLARILHAAHRTRATVVLVGDPRQLAPVGPGGAIAATLQAHPEIVTVMRDNVRQRNWAERDVLLEIRHGDIDTALAWYATDDRIEVRPEQLDTLHAMTARWLADIEAGHDTLMLAWRRETVRSLNRFARAAAGDAGRLHGDDLIAPGGRPYAVGDQVVTLRPNYRGDLVTSQRAEVVHVDHEHLALTIRTDDGRLARLEGDEIDAHHLDHGYALTVHRTQGATADRVHYLAEGGGRELAYVALSRARDHTTIHTVADTLDQALDDLAYQWSTTQARDWVSLTHAPASRRDEIVAELRLLNEGVPPDQRAALGRARTQLDQQRRDLTALHSGTGHWRDLPEGQALRALNDALRRQAVAEQRLITAGLLARRQAQSALHRATAEASSAELRWTTTVRPTLTRLNHEITTTEQQLVTLETAQTARDHWLHLHPHTAARLAALERVLLHFDQPDLARTLDYLDKRTTPIPNADRAQVAKTIPELGI